MNIGSFVIRLNALVFVLYGLLFVLAPEVMSQFVTGEVPGSSSGLIDMRATYGGMSLAVGAILFVFGKRDDLNATGLLAVFIIMLCMAGGRIVGIFVDGDANQLMYIYLALELVMASFAGFLISRYKS